MNRFLLIAPVVIGLHWLFLVIPFGPFRELPPAPTPVKRVFVTLAPKTVTQQMQKQPSAKAEKKKEEAVKTESRAEKMTPPPVLKSKSMVKRKMEQASPEAKQVSFTPKNVSPAAAAEIGAEETKNERSAKPGPQQEKAGAQVIRKAIPLYQVNPPPDYPYQARRRGFEGTVVLEALISVSGRVAELKLVVSSGHDVLDRAAMKAVRKWGFTPGSQGGVIKEMWVRVPVSFQLKRSN